ncbi:hypothetical protein E3U55_01060 [Filobacillus milosensis]|uniref:Spore coat protein n=1 Tax=Filobacillus milosensis TaxID=94137 RepID=A0A4Y8ISY3_9BACI|nr:hypothetical protein [Filobacillus milosensis]TFB25010.1 hypothetical protein E3U55_01060 [Filobacillus milosensis]
MRALPSVDLGIMAEHLAAHEGVINKLQYYHSIASNQILKDILSLQTEIMLNHVEVMSSFINPRINQELNVPPLDIYQDVSFNFDSNDYQYHDNWITLETHNTAKCMANQNYVSSLMMKDARVKKAHEEMALQQAHIQELYGRLISMMDWSYVPQSSIDSQTKTYQFYNQVFQWQ